MTDFKQAEKEIAENKDEIADKLAGLSLTDVLLFLCPNDKIRKRQVQKWLPVLRWLNKKFNLEMEKTESLLPPDSNEKNLQVFKKILEEMPIKKFTAFYFTALKLKSPLLALAYVEGKISMDEAFNLAFLEELCQNEEWGVDTEAAENRAQIRKELQETDVYFKS